MRFPCRSPTSNSLDKPHSDHHEARLRLREGFAIKTLPRSTHLHQTLSDEHLTWQWSSAPLFVTESPLPLDYAIHTMYTCDLFVERVSWRLLGIAPQDRILETPRGSWERHGAQNPRSMRFAKTRGGREACKLGEFAPGNRSSSARR